MQKPPIIWTNVLLFSITFLISAIAVPYYALTVGFSTTEIVATILCLGYCGMSITAGYHRLWAHKTYEAHPLLQWFFAIGGAFALQNSALHWSSDHRVHHKFVDQNDKDPYSAKRGFWFSHIGWMLREYQSQRYSDYSNVRDLQNNAIVMFQHKHYLLLTIATNFGIPLFLGFLTDNYLGMLLSVGVLRLVLSHHFTFFINSLAHIWGNQPYTDENSARDNGVLAFLTYGEGYHNFHHIFEYDYRNGIRWWQFDPTKWLIKTCSWLGLTRNLKVCPEDRIMKAKALMQLKRAQAKAKLLPDAELLLARMEQEYALLLERMQAYYSVQKQLYQQKKDELQQKKVQLLQQYNDFDIRKQYQEMKQNWLQQQRQWQSFIQQYA
ncbi:fatty acid desaturase [Rheinheimera sp. 4Y26]|uniref:acyl-CoA desaturase n=1 Tax=Rheinheimera sp. 4Y26 TaxID=2977811 RepID=UPI0021B10B1E|nr:fatty acid desaturase [Rheinheimera sp. 4Y26]MCT6701257.1 fatty acid desaturase [Rheinheimera sp. 4Y26]